MSNIVHIKLARQTVLLAGVMEALYVCAICLEVCCLLAGSWGLGSLSDPDRPNRRD